MMVMGFFLNSLCLIPTSEKKFVMFWSFPFVLKKYDFFFHNMLFLMLDPKFKSLHFMFSFIGCEEGVCIIE
jgi:hypothetical protein